jgi:ferritin-like metal-binding protein YciE
MTETNIRDRIVDWLRDAYVMERSQEVALEKIHGDSDESIACRTSAAMHLTETRQHARIVESLLRSLGAEPLSFKTELGVLTEKVKELTTTLSDDQQIKDLLTDYAIESFEIACYSAIAVAAEIAGLSQIANDCRQIILDEERMAETIRKELPRSVQEYFGATPMAKAA